MYAVSFVIIARESKQRKGGLTRKRNDVCRGRWKDGRRTLPVDLMDSCLYR